jgi:hypothetical protein
MLPSLWIHWIASFFRPVCSLLARLSPIAGPLFELGDAPLGCARAGWRIGRSMAYTHVYAKGPKE